MKYTKEDILKREKNSNLIKKVIVTILYIIIIPITFANLYLLMKSYREPFKTPSIFGYKTYVIISGSMVPNFNIGDVVIVKETSKEKLNVGDVISFKSDDATITHRITNVFDGKYETKGDNNNTKDQELVNYENVEGKYIAKIPKFGNLVIMFKNKLGLILAIITIALIYIHELKIKIKKQIRKEKRKN